MAEQSDEPASKRALRVPAILRRRRAGPGAADMWGSRRRRRPVVILVVCAVSVAVAVVVGGQVLADQDLLAPPAAGPQLPPETAAPTAAPPVVDSTMPSVQFPFAGSPARRWAGGADGIVLPKARAVGGVPKEAVAAGLRETKAFLVAANLDRRVLNGARPQKALALLDPADVQTLTDVRARLAQPEPGHSPLTLFSRFDTDEVQLVGDTVKLRGRITVRPGEQHGEAEIHADYTFVYPVTRAPMTGDVVSRHDEPGDDVTRTVVRRTLTVSVAAPGLRKATPAKLWIREAKADYANGGCGQSFDGLFHPWFQQELLGQQSAGARTDPYDRSKPVDQGGVADDCRPFSRI